MNGSCRPDSVFNELDRIAGGGANYRLSRTKREKLFVRGITCITIIRHNQCLDFLFGKLSARRQILDDRASVFIVSPDLLSRVWQWLPSSWVLDDNMAVYSDCTHKWLLCHFRVKNAEEAVSKSASSN